MKLRIGTRRSRLALAQANEVAERLSSAGIEAELVPMTTSGDGGAHAADSPAGVKGLFVAEIVRALRDAEVDLAVHSAKDLPATDDEGVVVAAVPARADPADVLVTRADRLPAGGSVGTSSLRRRAQMLAWRPDVVVMDLRGNVDTRLRKLDEGEVDGVILARAGLERLGVRPPNAQPLPIVPAPGQGCLAVQARAKDREILRAVSTIDDADSHSAFDAERSLMRRLGGGCALPLGALATIHDGRVHLTALVATPDGARLVRSQVEGATPDEVAGLATDELLAQGAADILSEVRP